jgi:hypothetical protein
MFFLPWATALVLHLSGLGGQWGGCAFAQTSAKTDFDRSIAPLLVRHCLDCHSGAKPKGGLDLVHRQTAQKGGKSGPVIVPRKPEESLLWEYVGQDKMPPRKPLSAGDKELIKAWLEQGALWGTDPIDAFRATTDKRSGYDWWALQPVKKPAVPTERQDPWSRNPIDAFVLRKLGEKGLRPSAQADRRTLIRRLSFDLLGLPPTPEEVAAFVNDRSADAYDRLVARYLGSAHYGIRWARHWLDVVRFGESNGFEFNELRATAWPYRDWVVAAFNRDLPYDEFVRRQLAGDVLRPNDPDAVKATGFLVAGAFDTVGQNQQSEAMRRVVRQDELEDIVGSVGQTFLGLTVNCARCHDHKFDPVRQVEYYRLTAALGGVRHGERDITHLDSRVVDIERRIRELNAQFDVLEKPVRDRLRAERKPKTPAPPQPIARWDFRSGYEDRLGNLHAKAHGNARRVASGLKLDGASAFVETVPLDRELKAKTLEAWVLLDNLEQHGGGIISVQAFEGDLFDALVYGEINRGQWLAGSNNFVRSQSFRGPVESEANKKPVHLAVVYAEDGTITGYRNGQPYGQPYKSSGPALFKAGQARVLFGIRHAPALPDRMLAGVISRVRLYDRALTAGEVAASAAEDGELIAPETVAGLLTVTEQAAWQRLRADLNEQKSLLMHLQMKVYAVNPQTPEVARLLIRGNTQQPAEAVNAGGVAALSGVKADFGLPLDAPDAARRLRLAEWITAPQNPLFARVIVNRLWQHHFGVGIVETPNDFGFNGGRPSYPELLDWLAAELIERGWSLKEIQRMIVTSATYRQAGHLNPEAARFDASNRLLWRKTPMRLEAETVRDAALRAAGRLNMKMDGPGFQDFKRIQAVGTTAFFFTPADPVGNEFNRRTLYRTWARGGGSPLLDAFDCPDPSTAVPNRAVTTTPLQALAMLNNSQVLRLAGQFAARVEREAGRDVGRQVAHAYLLAYGRQPRDDELVLAKRVVEKHGLEVLTRAIFNSNEFLYID